MNWSRWPRAYHDTAHLHACLQHLHAVQHDLPGVLHNPAAMALALWFHDAVYWPWSAHNEERSADWAREALVDAEEGVEHRAMDRRAVKSARA